VVQLSDWCRNTKRLEYRSLRSPDLAPRDFCLFPTLKDQLDKMHTADGDELFEQLLDILSAIPVDKLERGFTAWVDRVREMREGTDDYIAQ
jgi:hypothetical protein